MSNENQKIDQTNIQDKPKVDEKRPAELNEKELDGVAGGASLFKIGTVKLP